MRLRGFLLALFLLGAVGSGAELLLLGHTEDAWQWVPLVLLALSLAVLGWWGFQRGPASLWTFRAVMLLFVLAGFAGLYLHYDANAEFELELYPTLEGFALFREAVQGATPALAPGMMVHLGLLGGLATWRRSRTTHSADSHGDPP